MKANFIKRFIAYFLDILLVSLIFWVITMGVNNTKVIKLNEQLSDVQEKYLEGDLKNSEYINQTASLIYDTERASAVTNTVYVVLLVGYFIGFQYLNSGQTLGKKVMHIKVVQDGKDPSLLSMIVRTMITDGILVNLLLMLLVYVLNVDSYLMVYIISTFLYGLFILVSAVMILYRKDKLGLHDMMSKTWVEEV